MELHWADAIDSPCTGCGGQAVDWVQVQDGTRRYACEDCLDKLLRYGAADSLQALPETPNAVQCPTCERLTLLEDVAAANRCPNCAPEDPEKLLEQAQRVLDEGDDQAEG